MTMLNDLLKRDHDKKVIEIAEANNEIQRDGNNIAKVALVFSMVALVVSAIALFTK